jgi:all-trans-retinol dehydrogenase (NAD+)
MDFSGKHVVVTGAAGALGRRMVARFAELGAHVAAWDLNEEGLRTLDRTADRVRTYACDLTAPDAILAAARATLEDLDFVDILVNNAGVTTGHRILDLPDRALENTFAVNALAPFRVTRALLPSMIDRGAGHVVTIASAGGLIGTPRLSAYSASKAAAVSFDEALRLEMKASGLNIRTTVVCPYFVDSELFAGVQTRFSLVLPILSPDRVVEGCLRAIYRKKPRLVMPRFVYVTYLCRLLPVSWFDGLSRFFGITRAMDSYRGSPKGRPE